MQSIQEWITPLIQKAGKTMLEARNVESKDNITVKPGDANFVTVYDVAIQEFLIQEIKKQIPEACFIAEEQENDTSILSREYCFLIDPIDGTSNFICDYHHSAISVAMFSYGVPVFGAVYDPYLNELFLAERGKGAYLNGMPIHASKRPLELAMVAFGSAPYYKEQFGEKTFQLLKKLFLCCSDIRRCGSAALDLAYLAAGRNDIFFECCLSPWDIAAGSLLITEAGGVISDMNGNPIDFSKPTPVIAANAEIYPAVLEKIRETGL